MEINSVDRIAAQIIDNTSKDFRTQVMSRIKRLKKNEKFWFDISKVDLQEVQKIVKEIQDKVWTYTSSGTLAVQKK